MPETPVPPNFPQTTPVTDSVVIPLHYFHTLISRAYGPLSSHGLPSAPERPVNRFSGREGALEVTVSDEVLDGHLAVGGSPAIMGVPGAGWEPMGRLKRAAQARAVRSAEDDDDGA